MWTGPVIKQAPKEDEIDAEGILLSSTTLHSGGNICSSVLYDSKWPALPEMQFFHLGPYHHRAILIDV